MFPFSPFSFLFQITRIIVPPPVALTYRELYRDTTKNPFSEEEEDRDVCYLAIYEVWWCTHALLVPGGDFSTRIIKLIHGVASFAGTHIRSRDHMTTFVYEG
jgi:hypothetical protein